MRSTSGAHFVALDHIRAVAAVLVFTWHFTHGLTGMPVPFGTAPWLAFLDEGHVGVALFMTLSGYLFAKLLDGKRMLLSGFLLNRALRLLPLLVFVFLVHAAIQVVGARDFRQAYRFLLTLPQGLVYPTWPKGGWSITAELHFYLLLPLLLALQRRSAIWLVLILCISMTLRAVVFHYQPVQPAAYFTIVGRIDQFVLGILAFHWRSPSHVWAAATALAFWAFYYTFDASGGFYGTTTSPIWVVMPLIEGAALAVLIAWYDGNFSPSGSLSTAVAKVGEYSYSIYLLHPFVVFGAAKFIHTRVVDLSDFHLASIVSLVAFTAMLPLGYLSMRFIEAPFLRRRRPYYIQPNRPATQSLDGGVAVP